jgi:glycine/serine hydroxymethyltransferase
MTEWKSNAQKCLHKLCNELLGEDYYIVDPVSGNQANEIVTQDIIKLYKPKPKLTKTKKFYDYLLYLGISVLIISVINTFIYHLFDINVSIVLMPMSFAFSWMISIIRGQWFT